MKCVLVILIFANLCVSILYAKQLPTFIKKCRRDSELSNCVKATMMRFRKMLHEGVKALNVGPLDPYVIPRTSVAAPWVNVSFTDLKLYNAFDYEVDYFNINLDNNTITINITQKYLEIKSQYSVDGNILQFDLHTNGRLEANFSNAKSQAILYGTRIFKNGKEYLNIDTIDFIAGDHVLDHLYLYDVLKDNPKLKEILNTISLDEEKHKFYTEVFPLIEKLICEAVVVSYFKVLFDTYSFSELFL